MTTTEQTTVPRAGIDVEDPLRVAAELRDEFRLGAAERDRDRRFPYEQCAAFRASGLLGLMVPREHGGYGGTFVDLMQVVVLISAGDSNIGQMYQLHTGGIRLLQEFASPRTQADWLPRFASGELWITNAYSEVGTKSVNDFNTTVTRDGMVAAERKEVLLHRQPGRRHHLRAVPGRRLRRGEGVLLTHRRRGRDDP